VCVCVGCVESSLAFFFADRYRQSKGGRRSVKRQVV